MSVSSPLGKDFTREWFEKQTDIKSILDVGAGSGTYYDLLGPNYFWIAMEVWPENVDRYKLYDKYNLVITADISKYNILLQADCIIFGDVVEHMPKRTSLRVLRKAISEFPHVVVSIPLGRYEQGEVDGNPYEKHLSTWNYEEIENLACWKLTKTFPINPNLPEVLKIGVFIK